MTLTPQQQADAFAAAAKAFGGFSESHNCSVWSHGTAWEATVAALNAYRDALTAAK